MTGAGSRTLGRLPNNGAAVPIEGANLRRRRDAKPGAHPWVAQLPKWEEDVNRATRICAGLSASAMLIALLPGSLATASTRRDCWRHRDQEVAFARKMNLTRTRRGVDRFSLDRHLSKVARRHTREMTSLNRLYHTPSRALRRRVTRWLVLGENVGVGHTVRSLHGAFMDSPPHRHNILDRSFAYVGVGTRRAHGRLWVTVIFESRNNPGTRLPMPSC